MLQAMQTRLAALEKTVVGLQNITIEGFNKRQSAGGTAFMDGSREVHPINLPNRTIVIVKEPVAGDSVLIVREAKYADVPPVPCTRDTATPPNVTCRYAWYGLDFKVNPPLGKECIDYKGDEQVPADDAHPPKLDTVFHRCHREHDAWVLDLQAEGGDGGIIPARVLSVGTSTIRVQTHERNAADTAWVVTADPPENVFLWDVQAGSDFEVGDMIPLIVHKGKKYAMQYLWFFNKTPTGMKGDCGL